MKRQITELSVQGKGRWRGRMYRIYRQELEPKIFYAHLHVRGAKVGRTCCFSRLRVRILISVRQVCFVQQQTRPMTYSTLSHFSAVLHNFFPRLRAHMHHSLAPNALSRVKPSSTDVLHPSHLNFFARSRLTRPIIIIPSTRSIPRYRTTFPI